MTLVRVTLQSVCCGFVAHEDRIVDAAPWIYWFARKHQITGAHALVRELRRQGAEVERVENLEVSK